LSKLRAHRHCHLAGKAPEHLLFRTPLVAFEEKILSEGGDIVGEHPFKEALGAQALLAILLNDRMEPLDCGLALLPLLEGAQRPECRLELRHARL
jgi:hypothetical protein